MVEGAGWRRSSSYRNKTREWSKIAGGNLANNSTNPYTKGGPGARVTPRRGRAEGPNDSLVGAPETSHSGLSPIEALRSWQLGPGILCIGWPRSWAPFLPSLPQTRKPRGALPSSHPLGPCALASARRSAGNERAAGRGGGGAGAERRVPARCGLRQPRL